MSSNSMIRPELKCLGSVKPRSVKFLWEPYLPIGKLSIALGDPGVGKSTVTAYLAARISRGLCIFSDSEPNREPANVVFLTTEDDDDDTIVPRLDRFGADREKIFLCDQPLDFGHGGLDVVESYLIQRRPALLIIDPIQVYAPNKDTNRANETRSFLAPLAALAKKYQTVILVLMHMNKVGSGSVLYRGLGSIDFIGCCRSALAAAKLDDGRHVLVHIKSNVARLGPSFRYMTPDFEFELALAPDISSKDLSGAPQTASGPNKLEQAELFVEDALSASDPLAATELQKRAEAKGISLRTLKRAYKELGVRAVKCGDEWFKTLSEEGQRESD